MKNGFRSCLWILAIVAIQAMALGLTDSAHAQRGGRGMRGGLTVPKFQIVQVEKVQQELKLDDEVTEKLQGLADSAREKMMAARDENQDDLSAMGKAMDEISTELAKATTELLEEKQVKRLHEIYLQVNGAMALTDKEVTEQLKLDSKQTEELESSIQGSLDSLREMFGQFREMEQEERQEAMSKWQTERDEKMMKVLTEEQQKAFKEAKGEAFEFDPADFRRGGRGRGGRGGQRGQRGQRGAGNGGGQDYAA